VKAPFSGKHAGVGFRAQRHRATLEAR
jgi:hypothetical protein